MRQFDNPYNIAKEIANLRLRKIDPNGEAFPYQIEKLDGGIFHYLNTESSLPEDQLIALFNQAETAEEVTYFADDEADRQQLKAEYQATITQLQSIENATSPTNAQVIAAVKFLAKTIRLLLKLLARLLG
jgi:hypothetical protein